MGFKQVYISRACFPDDTDMFSLCYVLYLPSEYSPENCKHYKLFSSYDSMITTGPDQRSSAPAQDTISDEESNEEDQSQEDHYALLVQLT